LFYSQAESWFGYPRNYLPWPFSDYSSYVMGRASSILVFAAIASGVVLFAQQPAPSLGDIARKYRTEKIEREHDLREGAIRQPAAEASAVQNSGRVSLPASPALSVVAPVHTATADVAPRREMEVRAPATEGLSSVPQSSVSQSNIPRAEAVVPAGNTDLNKTPVLLIRQNNQVTKPAAALPNQPSVSTAQRVPVAAGKAASKDSVSAPAKTPVFAPAVAQPVTQRRTPLGTPELITAKSNVPTPATVPVQFASAPQQAPVLIHTSANTKPNMAMDDIYKSISQNLQTPEGEKYNGVFAWEFSLKDSRVLKECLAIGTNDPGPFDVVVEVSGDGKAQQSMIFPDTGVSGCLQHRLATTSFSPPPRAGYWVRVTLTK
jgi:hypothetical protein